MLAQKPEDVTAGWLLGALFWHALPRLPLVGLDNPCSGALRAVAWKRSRNRIGSAGGSLTTAWQYAHPWGNRLSSGHGDLAR